MRNEEPKEEGVILSLGCYDTSMRLHALKLTNPKYVLKNYMLLLLKICL